MAEVLLSKNAITVYEVLVILVLVVILVRQKKKNRELQERREITNAKIRNQKLEQKLKNPDSDMDWSKDPNPFAVQYMPEAEAHVKAASDLQIEIEVHTEMSVQRYLFDLNEEITIGRCKECTAVKGRDGGGTELYHFYEKPGCLCKK